MRALDIGHTSILNGHRKGWLVALHDDLLEQAKHLAVREANKPRQASLRRAVSAAYYSVFHLLAHEGAKRFVPSTPKNLRLHIERAFVHGEMKAACEFFAGASITNPQNSGNLLHLIAPPIEPELSSLSATFVDLQQARHIADYDHRHQFSRLSALFRVSQADQAFKDWTSVRNRPNANVFLALLLFQNRWRK
jgi:hypothetical protein